LETKILSISSRWNFAFDEFREAGELVADGTVPWRRRVKPCFWTFEGQWMQNLMQSDAKSRYFGEVALDLEIRKRLVSFIKPWNSTLRIP